MGLDIVLTDNVAVVPAHELNCDDYQPVAEEQKNRIGKPRNHWVTYYRSCRL